MQFVRRPKNEAEAALYAIALVGLAVGLVFGLWPVLDLAVSGLFYDEAQRNWPWTRDPVLMDARIFRPEPMGLRDDLLSIPLEQRFTYDPQQNLFFVNFERFSVHNRAMIRTIVNTVEDKLAPLGHRVYAIVNYDNFSILPELLDEYSAAVRGIVDRFYSGVSRYTTSGFLRMKLGEALEKRGLAPHIFESAKEAESELQAFEKTAAE